MKKILFFTIFCTFIICIIFLMISYRVNHSTPQLLAIPTPQPTHTILLSPTPTVVPFPTAIPFSQTADTITINNVILNNFTKTANSIDPQGDRTIVNTNGYAITFLAPFNQFLISITKAPFDTYRQQAEQAFLLQLNISQEEACKLSAYIATSGRVNPDQAGKTYPLSFCP